MRDLIKKQVGWIVCAVIVIVMLPMMTEDVSAEVLYDITWRYEDGSLIDVTHVPAGTVPTHEDPVPKTSPTREVEYYFAGWDPTPSAANGSAEYKATVAERPRNYEITWQYPDGMVIDITNVAYGTMPSHENPIMEQTAEYTYTFVSWDPEVTPVDGLAVYTAIINQTKNKYAVRFETYGGTAIGEELVEYGASVNRPNDPKLDGCTFKGWFKDSAHAIPFNFDEPITGPTTVYAKFIKPIPELTGKQKPVSKNTLKEDGNNQLLVLDPEELPEYYTIEYSTDNGKTWSKNPVGKESGDYVVKVRYKATDEDYKDFYGDDLKVKIEGVYNQIESDKSWTKGRGLPFRIQIKKAFNDDKCFDNYKSVFVDGKQPQLGKDFTIAKGSIVITFAPEYMESLSEGEHTIRVNFTDGETLIKLTVGETEITQIPEKVLNETTTAPDTGEGRDLTLYIILLMMYAAMVMTAAVGGMKAIEYSQRRKKY